VFTFNRNSRSPSTEISVHVEPKWVFTIDRNTHSTWWAWVKAGKAPAPVKISAGVTCWRKADVLAMTQGAKA
jgi:hypothetical protein